MKCPTDNETLVMTERSGVEIDYCPKCRGVWLDRGELDKIIAQSAVQPSSAPPPRAQRDHRDDDDDDDRPDRGGKPRRRRRESFLDELFDF